MQLEMIRSYAVNANHLNVEMGSNKCRALSQHTVNDNLFKHTNSRIHMCESHSRSLRTTSIKVKISINKISIFAERGSQSKCSRFRQAEMERQTFRWKSRECHERDFRWRILSILRPINKFDASIRTTWDEFYYSFRLWPYIRHDSFMLCSAEWCWFFINSTMWCSVD